MEYSINFKRIIQKAKDYSDGIIEPDNLFKGLLSVPECKGYALLYTLNPDKVDSLKKKLKINTNTYSRSSDWKLFYSCLALCRQFRSCYR